MAIGEQQSNIEKQPGFNPDVPQTPIPIEGVEGRRPVFGNDKVNSEKTDSGISNPETHEMAKPGAKSTEQFKGNLNGILDSKDISSEIKAVLEGADINDPSAFMAGLMDQSAEKKE